MAKRAKDPKEKEAEEGEEDDSEQPWWATALAVIFLVGLVVDDRPTLALSTRTVPGV